MYSLNAKSRIIKTEARESAWDYLYFTEQEFVYIPCILLIKGILNF